INGSGTFDVPAARIAFGGALDANFPFAAYVSKTITLEPREGNAPPRLWESPGGLINSIGLPNKGLESYLAQDLPGLAGLATQAPRPPGAGGALQRAEADRAWPVPLITNVMGSNAEEFARLVEACQAREEV